MVLKRCCSLHHVNPVVRWWRWWWCVGTLRCHGSEALHAVEKTVILSQLCYGYTPRARLRYTNAADFICSVVHWDVPGDGYSLESLTHFIHSLVHSFTHMCHVLDAVRRPAYTWWVWDRSERVDCVRSWRWRMEGVSRWMAWYLSSSRSEIEINVLSGRPHGRLLCVRTYNCEPILYPAAYF